MPDLTKWLDESALERRYVTVIAAGLLGLLALFATNQRSIFTPWDPGANPLLKPSAFFAAPGLPLSNNGFRRPRSPGGIGIGERPSRQDAVDLVAGPGGDTNQPPVGADAEPPNLPTGNSFNTGVPSIGDQVPFSGLPIGPTGSSGAAAPPATLDPGGTGAPTGAVPETTTWIMLVLGFLATGLALRRPTRAMKVMPTD